MDIKAVTKVLKEIKWNGKIATQRQARKAHKCSECGFLIPAGTGYYEVVFAGSGLSSLKFPDHVHTECLKIDEGVENG